MAYENTEVPVSKTQESLRKLLASHGGFGVAIVSDKDPALPAAEEGFTAKVTIDKKPYTVRIMAHLKKPSQYLSDNQKARFIEQEERRVWRVLYWHMKSVFEAADSGVMEFRELMLPYLVMGDGQTVAQIILPRLDAAISDQSKLLNANN